jgi:hypothetical protein
MLERGKERKSEEKMTKETRRNGEERKRKRQRERETQK